MMTKCPDEFGTVPYLHGNFLQLYRTVLMHATWIINRLVGSIVCRASIVPVPLFHSMSCSYILFVRRG